MPNTQLRHRIDGLPDDLLNLETRPEVSGCLKRVETMRDHARSLEPLDGVEGMALSDYDRDWLVRYTYNSNAIEGSTLTLQDTSLVLEGEFVPSDSPARFVFAARGVADGMAYVRRYVCEGRELDLDLIRRIHEVTALDLQPFARGTFRPYGYQARITATKVKTADPLDIQDDLLSWTATVGPAVSCSTTWCWRLAIVLWRSNTMRDVSMRVVSNRGKWTAIPYISALPWGGAGGREWEGGDMKED